MTVLPRWYFFGLIAGLASLSILGTQLRPHGFAESFVRYHQFISAESGMIPTPREIETIIDARAAGNPIFVIVGGSSILNGVGQQPDDIWTRELQRLLGDRYRVINFALRSGRADECAMVAAEMLLQRRLPVIYVTEGIRTIRGTAGRHARCVYHAWLRGHLLEWAPREDDLRFGWLRSRTRLDHNISGLLDAVLNFENVWHYLSYEHLSPVWSPLLREHSFTAKAFLPDTEQTVDILRQYRLKRPHLEAELRSARVAAESIVRQQREGRPEAMDRVEAALPPALRAVTIAALSHYDPAIVSMLSAEQQRALARRHDFLAAGLKNIGVADVVIAPQFGEDDYLDLLHLLPSGGRKLAQEVAPSIRTLAQKLGYIHE